MYPDDIIGISASASKLIKLASELARYHKIYIKVHKMKYKVLSLDVWAGEEKGEWVKNNFFHVDTIEFPLYPYSEDIIESLIQIGFLNAKTRKKVLVEDYNGMGEYYNVTDNKGYPLCDLVEDCLGII